MKRIAKIDADKCKGCEYCIYFCPRKAIRKSGTSNTKGYDYVIIDNEKCIGCSICYSVCPDCCVVIYEIEKKDNEK
jgi:2-oxoglutarate ferredoxin oxidoreductase subunit delta